MEFRQLPNGEHVELGTIQGDYEYLFYYICDKGLHGDVQAAASRLYYSCKSQRAALLALVEAFGPSTNYHPNSIERKAIAAAEALAKEVEIG